MVTSLAVRTCVIWCLIRNYKFWGFFVFVGLFFLNVPVFMVFFLTTSITGLFQGEGAVVERQRGHG